MPGGTTSHRRVFTATFVDRISLSTVNFDLIFEAIVLSSADPHPFTSRPGNMEDDANVLPSPRGQSRRRIRLDSRPLSVDLADISLFQGIYQ